MKQPSFCVIFVCAALISSISSQDTPVTGEEVDTRFFGNLNFDTALSAGVGSFLGTTFSNVGVPLVGQCLNNLGIGKRSVIMDNLVNMRRRKRQTNFGGGASSNSGSNSNTETDPRVGEVGEVDVQNRIFCLNNNNNNNYNRYCDTCSCCRDSNCRRSCRECRNVYCGFSNSNNFGQSNNFGSSSSSSFSNSNYCRNCRCYGGYSSCQRTCCGFNARTGGEGESAAGGNGNSQSQSQTQSQPRPASGGAVSFGDA